MRPPPAGEREHRGTGAANDLLLRGDELADAKTWLARRKENAPEITALLTSFLTASEERAAALANQEQERLAERERLVAEREHAQHNVRRVCHCEEPPGRRRNLPPVQSHT